SGSGTDFVTLNDLGGGIGSARVLSASEYENGITDGEGQSGGTPTAPYNNVSQTAASQTLAQETDINALKITGTSGRTITITSGNYFNLFAGAVLDLAAGNSTIGSTAGTPQGGVWFGLSDNSFGRTENTPREGIVTV